MLGNLVPDVATATFGTLSQLFAVSYGSELGLAAVALAGLLALAFARRTARHHALAAPLGLSHPHLHHLHRVSPYVRQKDVSVPGRELPRAP